MYVEFVRNLGVEPPQDRKLDGTSLTPLFSGQPLKRGQPLFWHYYNALGEPKLALRDGDYMLVATVDAGSGGAGGGGFRPEMMPLIKEAKPIAYELYDLTKDIGQENDLASTQPAKTAALAKELNRIWSEVQAEGPDWRKAQ